MHSDFYLIDGVMRERAWHDLQLNHGFTANEQFLPLHTSYPKQVHGINDMAVAGTAIAVMTAEPADIIWTRTPNRPIAVQTADCMPLLFAAESMVMAVHAGWRGLSQRIISKALGIMQSFGISEDQVAVRVGPFISESAFEVGPEVVDIFAAAFSDLPQFKLSQMLTAGQNDRSYLDLKAIANQELQHIGILPAKIKFADICTKSSPEWHSYRRDRQDAGRNWAWIALGGIETSLD